MVKITLTEAEYKLLEKVFVCGIGHICSSAEHHGRQTCKSKVVITHLHNQAVEAEDLFHKIQSQKLSQ